MNAYHNTNRPLPAGWRWANLGEVLASAQAGFAIGERDEEGVIQLRMNNVTNNGRFDWTSFIRVPAQAELIELYRLEKGDVLFNNTNSTELVGKSALFDRFQEPVVYSNHFNRLRTNNEKLFPEFLALWLQQKWQEGLFAEICNRWIGQSAVQRSKLLALEILLPPLDEQKRIAAILQEQLNAVNQAREAAQAQLAAARALPSAYLRQVFNSPEAATWQRKKLGDVCEIIARQVDPTIPEFAVLPHISGENIERMMCRVTNIKSASEDGMTSGKYIFDAGDVIYSKLRPYLRKAYVAEFPGLCSADIYPIKVNPAEFDPHFMAWMLVADEFSAYAEEQSRRARMPKLNREQLFSWDAPIPPLPRQRQLIGGLIQRIEASSKVKQLLEEQLAAIERLPAKLLERAFNGEV